MRRAMVDVLMVQSWSAVPAERFQLDPETVCK